MKFKVAFVYNMLKGISLNTIAIPSNIDWTVFVELFSLEKHLKVDLMCPLNDEELIEHLLLSG